MRPLVLLVHLACGPILRLLALRLCVLYILRFEHFVYDACSAPKGFHSQIGHGRGQSVQGDALAPWVIFYLPRMCKGTLLHPLFLLCGNPLGNHRLVALSDPNGQKSRAVLGTRYQDGARFQLYLQKEISGIPTYLGLPMVCRWPAPVPDILF